MGQFRRRILSTLIICIWDASRQNSSHTPQTAINLRRHLSGIGNIDEDIPTTLFVSASSQTLMDDTDRVPIPAYPGLGTQWRSLSYDRRSLESAVPEADLPASQEASTPFET